MGPKYAESEAEERERQARIEQDIRRLFARYRRMSRKNDDRTPQAARPAPRFASEPRRARPRAT
jgi:hypothetical protein